MKKPSFLVLCGDGINCERETAFALDHAGAEARIIHVNDLLETPEMLESADGFAIPGGFSFGDELGSGQILALKIRHKLGDCFFKMVAAQKPVIGICNGFQVLVKLGLLPYPAEEERILALAANEQGSFINRWVTLEVEAASRCLWTQGLEKNRIELPIRHGEGRIAFRPEAAGKNYARLVKDGLIPLRYTQDVNGSYERIAALTDPSGAVLGLMPHPEAFIFNETYKTPGARAEAAGDGALIFKNILRIMKGEDKNHERRFA